MDSSTKFGHPLPSYSRPLNFKHHFHHSILHKNQEFSPIYPKIMVVVAGKEEKPATAVASRKTSNSSSFK
ncbi:hypothetical protein CDL12_10208 [Handroanthus impetiginosus]|uniref:Uncharacterized protein n=1 Tax=Handroanthus impetiginosus TaxID=429701 RepID=A0A2G9HIL8_9LAMI|nr:hypothetical protein CDL12_10208 [Handroanthus impetiginosus]